MRHKKRVSLSVLAAIGVLAPINLYAFGLGPLTLNSALNQPFNAEIEVTSLRESEEGNLQVRLASVADFERAGLDRNFLLTQFNFEVVERGDSAIVRITTTAPVKEPFLDFLLSASAGEGRLIRSYTVLLDPPTEIYQRRSQTTPAPLTITQAETLAPTSQALTRSTPTTSQARYDGSQYQVQRNDTLWKIAQRVRSSDAVSIQQMMLALFEENPRAFQNNNMNSLRADAVLTVPESTRATQTSQRDAISKVNQQIAAWQQRNQPAAAARAPSPDIEEAKPQTAELSEDVSASTEANRVLEFDLGGDLAEQVVVEDVARLKLVTADESGDESSDPMMVGDPEVRKLSEQLTLAQETIESQTQENIDFKSRMDAMEAQMETMRRLLSLKDADMARLQQILEQQENDTTDAEALAIIAGEGQFETETSAQQVTDESLESITADTTIETDSVTSDTDHADVSATNDTNEILEETFLDDTMVMSEAELSDAYENASTDFVASTETESGRSSVGETHPSIVNKAKAIIANYMMELLLAALLIILLLAFVIRQRNKPQQWQQATQKTAPRDNTKRATPTVIVSDTTTPTPQEAKVQDLPKKSTQDFVEQADMFVGYADYVQAKHALDQARLQQPTDKEIATKLLYVLFKQQKSADFLSVLSDSDINADDSQWEDIAAWGHELMPNNALFIVAKMPNTQPEEVIADEETKEAVPEDFAETESISVTSELEETSAIEFNIEDYAQTKADTVETEQSYAHDTSEFLDFEHTTNENDAIAADMENTFESDNTLENDSSNPHDLGEMVEVGETQILDLSDSFSHEDDSNMDDDATQDFEPRSELLTDLSDVTNKQEDLISDTLDRSELDYAKEADLDFDVGDFDEIDEAETKLDLANAYVDMGDPEGARGILEEVLKEGTEEQQHRAQSLIESLA